MYESYVGANGNTLYRRMLHDVLRNGIEVYPRGKRTLEIQAVTQIIDPLQRVLTVPGRGANPFFNVAENLAIIGAWEDQRSWLGIFNKNYLNFFDNETDEQTWAFYGDRLRKWGQVPNKSKGDETPHAWHSIVDQLQEITKRLEADRSSRQAVAALWHPLMDNMPGHRDYPCNFSVKFSIRDFSEINRSHTATGQVLHMTVFNRSNDIHWGLFGVNLSQWSFIQEVVAKTLGVPVGHQIHISDSLHLYTDSEPHQVITENMAKYKDGFDIYQFCKPTPMFPINLQVLPWEAIDRNLRLWKGQFQRFMRGDTTIIPQFDEWPFLKDAFYFLAAYLYRKDRRTAVDMLSSVKDPALWVAGVEWMVRGKAAEEVGMNQIKDGVQFRFPVVAADGTIGRTEYNGRFTSTQDAVVEYILSSNMLEAQPKASVTKLARQSAG